jgi:hypothetical protein
MEQYTKISVFLLISFFATLSGCIKEEQYPLEPKIDFVDFNTYRDITDKDSLGEITISYTDGDGDIGLNSYDTVEPYKYNYYLKFMQLINDQLVEVKPVDSNITFNSRIPILTPAGRNKNIKGNIRMSLEIYFARQLLQSNTIAFEIYIKDRALNKSNVITTPLFIIKK